MAQISLYMEDSMVEQLTTAAETQNCSVSKYVASIISENLSRSESEENRKRQILKSLCGALDDPTFVIPSELSWEDEIPRRYDLYDILP